MLKDQTSASELQTALDTIPVLICTARPDGEPESVNKCWREYTGLALDETKDHGWVSAVHPEDLERFVEKWRTIIASGKPGDAEVRLRRFDGDYHRFFVRAVPHRDGSRRITRWLIRWYPTNAVEDISKAGAQIRHVEDELRAILNNAPVLAWSTFPDGWTDFLNERWLSTFNISWEEALGFGWARLIHPDDTANMLKQWQTSVLNGVPFATEARFRCFDGKYRWFLNRADPLRDKTGKVIKWYGTNFDIEDLKQTETRLRRSEAYLTEAQRLSLTGSFGWIPSTGEIHWSEESFRIFQYDPSVKPTVKLALRRVHPDDHAFVREAIDEASRGETNFDLTHRLLMPDGSIKYVHVRSRAVRDAEGNFEVVGAITDITATKKAEEALHENERRLHEAQAELSHIGRVATLGELTASITHEVNQPLSAIAANAAAAQRWITRSTPDIEEARSTIERIAREAHRAAAVISRMRELYKKADPKKVCLDINDVINDAMLLLRREATSSQVSLELELASGLPAVLGDRVQLQQVIINLSMNGIQAMANIADRPRELLIRSKQDEADQVVVAVQDLGSGIDPEIADKLFSPFLTTKPNGMGMGLSICRSIIEAHGGRVWAARNSGPGTTFNFTLETCVPLPVR
jgi:PAS domain S-box-containing protein